MGRGRRRSQPDPTVEPPAKMLRRRQSVRNRNMAHQIVNREMLLENDVESDPDSAIQNLITGRMRECKMDLTKAKVLQTQCLNLEESSDPVVRSLTALAVQQANALLGLSAALDSVFEYARENRQKMLRSEGHVTKTKFSSLPKGLRLHATNLTHSWRIEGSTPFKVKNIEKKSEKSSHICFYFHATNLNELLMRWKPLGRSVAKNDHNSLCTDFFRVYLVQACEPPSAIQHYTYRTTGRYTRKVELRDLPQNVVEPLIGCCLDGMGLGAKDLDLNVEDIIRSPTSFWKGFGSNDESRKKAFEIRKKQRANWGPDCRTALTRAMADIRQYIVRNGVLTPRPKHYTFEIEVPTSSASTTDGEDDPMPQ